MINNQDEFAAKLGEIFQKPVEVIGHDYCISVPSVYVAKKLSDLLSKIFIQELYDAHPDTDLKWRSERVIVHPSTRGTSPEDAAVTVDINGEITNHFHPNLIAKSLEGKEEELREIINSTPERYHELVFPSHPQGSVLAR